MRCMKLKPVGKGIRVRNLTPVTIARDTPLRLTSFTVIELLVVIAGNHMIFSARP